MDWLLSNWSEIVSIIGAILGLFGARAYINARKLQKRTPINEIKDLSSKK